MEGADIYHKVPQLIERPSYFHTFKLQTDKDELDYQHNNDKTQTIIYPLIT